MKNVVHQHRIIDRLQPVVHLEIEQTTLFHQLSLRHLISTRVESQHKARLGIPHSPKWHWTTFSKVWKNSKRSINFRFNHVFMTIQVFLLFFVKIWFWFDAFPFRFLVFLNEKQIDSDSPPLTAKENGPPSRVESILSYLDQTARTEVTNIDTGRSQRSTNRENSASTSVRLTAPPSPSSNRQTTQRKIAQSVAITQQRPPQPTVEHNAKSTVKVRSKSNSFLNYHLTTSFLANDAT